MPNDERKLPETRKELIAIIGLEGKAGKKMGKLKDLLEMFKEFNNGEKSIYTVEFIITSMYANKWDDKDIQKGVGNLLEHIGTFKKCKIVK